MRLDLREVLVEVVLEDPPVSRALQVVPEPREDQGSLGSQDLQGLRAERDHLV